MCIWGFTVSRREVCDELDYSYGFVYLQHGYMLLKYVDKFGSFTVLLISVSRKNKNANSRSLFFSCLCVSCRIELTKVFVRTLKKSRMNEMVAVHRKTEVVLYCFWYFVLFQCRRDGWGRGAQLLGALKAKTTQPQWALTPYYLEGLKIITWDQGFITVTSPSFQTDTWDNVSPFLF